MTFPLLSLFVPACVSQAKLLHMLIFLAIFLPFFDLLFGRCSDQVLGMFTPFDSGSSVLTFEVQLILQNFLHQWLDLSEKNLRPDVPTRTSRRRPVISEEEDEEHTITKVVAGDPIAAGSSLSVASASLTIVDSSPSVANASPTIVGDSPSVAAGYPTVVDASTLAVVVSPTGVGTSTSVIAVGPSSSPSVMVFKYVD